MQTVKLINDNLKKISQTNTLLDMLLDFEGVLDDLDIYVFKNWYDGEIIQGPTLRRYWIDVKLMFPYEKMPDPDALLRLQKADCVVKMYKGQLTEPVKVRSVEDTELVSKDGISRRRAKTKTSEVWFVEISMPRRYVDEFSTERVETEDEEYIDLEDIQSGQDQNVENLPAVGADLDLGI